MNALVRRCRFTLAVLAAALLLPDPAGASKGWSPDPPRHGVAVERNHEITMRDGTVLRANVYRPVDPATGRPAPGRFPVILSQTPYTKTRMEASGASEGGEYADRCAKHQLLSHAASDCS